MNKLLIKTDETDDNSISCIISSFRHQKFTDLFFASLLAIIFMVLVPVVEWPDAMDHVGRRVANETIYPFDVFSLLPNLKYPSINGEHVFFSDHQIYKFSLSYLLFNIERLPVILFFYWDFMFWLESLNLDFYYFALR